LTFRSKGVDSTKNIALIGAQAKRQVQIASSFGRYEDAFKIVCVVDDDPTVARRLADQFNAKYVRDVDSVLKDSSIDLVCLEVQYRDRPKLIESCSKTGKDVLCFSPVAYDVNDTKKILKTVIEGETRLFAPFVLRNHPYLRSAREMVRQDGRELASLHLSIKQAEVLGDVLSDLGPVAFDFVRWFTGFRISSMYCQSVDFDGEVGAETVIGRLENGALLSMDMIHSYTDETICEAIYSDALILMTPNNNSVRVEIAGDKKRDFPLIDPIDFAIDEVVASVNGGSELPVPYSDIEAAALLVEQARVSTEERKFVTPMLQ
jgi:predicted dehydrogenase